MTKGIVRLRPTVVLWLWIFAKTSPPWVSSPSSGSTSGPCASRILRADEEPQVRAGPGRG